MLYVIAFLLLILVLSTPLGKLIFNLVVVAPLQALGLAAIAPLRAIFLVPSWAYITLIAMVVVMLVAILGPLLIDDPAVQAGVYETIWGAGNGPTFGAGHNSPR